LIARILIWNLNDSKTTLDELREHLPELDDEGSHWISNEVAERFGLIALGDLPDLNELRELIGVDAVIYEEFDVE
jgi:hypothetical protein